MGGGGRPGELDRLLAVARALAAGRRLRILYQDAARRWTRHLVSPFGLGYREGYWLVATHCHLRRAFRLFRIERIRTASLARGRVDLRLAPPGFDPRFFSAEAYCVAGRDPPARATARLLPPLDELAGVLLPAALLDWSGPGVYCHLRVTDRPALLGLLASLGEAAALVAWRPASEPPRSDSAPR